jgi:hypothetical protein
MAAPLVAGCCAVIRSHLRERLGGSIPISGALMKVVLIKGAENILRHLVTYGPPVGSAPSNL